MRVTDKRRRNLTMNCTLPWSSSSSFSIFIVEGRGPQNDAQVLSSSSCLLLLSYNLPASSQYSPLYHLPIVSSVFLCFLRHLDDLQKYVCSGSVLWSCARSIAISVSLQCRSRSTRSHWFYPSSNWFAAYVCDMSSRKLWWVNINKFGSL